MSLGMQVGLGPNHIVLHGDAAPPPKKGHNPHFSAHLYCDQDATWYKGRPGPRPHCVTWGSSALQKITQPPIFGPCLLWSNGSPSRLSTC